jgi:uncharacterized protein (TIGR00251 family)
VDTLYRWQDGNLILSCHIQPKASCNEFVGCRGERLKIRITATATEGQVNAALIAFVAKAFGLGKQSVTLIAGEQSRQKTLKIIAPQTVPEALSKIIKYPST